MTQLIMCKTWSQRVPSSRLTRGSVLEQDTLSSAFKENTKTSCLTDELWTGDTNWGHQHKQIQIGCLE